jgi:hypothetical protein
MVEGDGMIAMSGGRSRGCGPAAWLLAAAAGILVFAAIPADLRGEEKPPLPPGLFGADPETLEKGQKEFPLTGGTIRREVATENVLIDGQMVARPKVKYFLSGPGGGWVPMQHLFINGGMLYFVTKTPSGTYVLHNVQYAHATGDYRVVTFTKPQCLEEMRQILLRSADPDRIRRLYDSPDDLNGDIGWLWHGLEGRPREAIFGDGTRAPLEETGISSAQFNRCLFTCKVPGWIERGDYRAVGDAYRSAIIQFVDTQGEKMCADLAKNGRVLVAVGDDAPLTTRKVLPVVALVVAVIAIGGTLFYLRRRRRRRKAAGS